MSFKEAFQWIFFGLNVNVSRCRLDPVSIAVQSKVLSNESKQFEETATIKIHNSSFGSLELNSGTKAQITECYIDSEFKDRPTLIVANNSEISIQNCQLEHFINKNGSTILFGGNNSHVTVENSVFIQNNSSMGVLLLHNNSFMHISSSLFSQNTATSLGYSSITLHERIHAVVHDTVFRNNSALEGGAMFAENHCQVKLTNCTISSNKAFTGKTLNIPKSPEVEMAAAAAKRNNIDTFTSIDPVLFNQTLSHGEKTKVIAAHRVSLMAKRKEKSGQKVGLLPGVGGAVQISTQSQLLVTNCVFENNSAQNVAGAICAALDVTLDLQETTFAGNKALLHGGAIYIQQQVHLRIKNCVFEENKAEQIGGAILGTFNTTLNIQETTFASNKALCEGGAIDVEQRAQLKIKHCVFDDNTSGQVGGAIFGVFNATLDVQETTFVGNTALYEGGAIDAQQQVRLQIKNCVFEENTSERLGGAIIVLENAMLDIQETNFTSNSARQGGAVHLNSASFLYATSCAFEDNHATGFGGALAGGIDAVLEIDRSRFLKNSALFAAAILATSNVTLNIQETTFVGNKASSDSGAILVKYQAHLAITNCLFEDNVSQRGLGGALTGAGNVTIDILETNFTGNSAVQGGALDVDKQSFLNVTDCAFEDNHANLGGAIFGGLHLVCIINGSYFFNNSASQGGAINMQQTANVLITNSKLERNFVDGGLGGGIMAFLYAKLRIRETNFTCNSASGRGGALFIDSQSECHVARCIFHGNTASTSGGAVGMYLKSSLQVENTNFTNNNRRRSYSRSGKLQATNKNVQLLEKFCKTDWRGH